MLEDSTMIIRESNLVAGSTNVINSLWTMVIDYVMDVIDSVMTEAIAGERCYECDGIFKKSSEKVNSIESESECNTVNKDQLEKNDSVQKFSFLPSPSSQKEVKRYI